MTADTTPDILILDLHDEPTVRDVDLGVRLGMDPPRSIRQTIRRHLEELQGYGTLHAVPAPPTLPGAGTGDVTEYHLTEEQALCLCLLSQAPQAAGARRMLILAFTAWRRNRDCPEQSPADRAGVITGPVTFLHARPYNTRFDWLGHTVSTDLSRTDKTRDMVALLPDGSIDIVRLLSRPYTNMRKG